MISFLSILFYVLLTIKCECKTPQCQNICNAPTRDYCKVYCLCPRCTSASICGNITLHTNLMVNLSNSDKNILNVTTDIQNICLQYKGRDWDAFDKTTYDQSCYKYFVMNSSCVNYCNRTCNTGLICNKTGELALHIIETYP